METQRGSNSKIFKVGEVTLTNYIDIFTTAISDPKIGEVTITSDIYIFTSAIIDHA